MIKKKGFIIYKAEEMELINLEKITLVEIQGIFNKYLINGIIDDDGDLLIPGSISVFLSIDEEKKILRFFGSLNTSYLKRDENEIASFANKTNIASNSIKYSPNKTKAIIFEYGIFQGGLVNEEYLVNTLKKILEEANDTRALFPLFDEVLGAD